MSKIKKTQVEVTAELFQAIGNNDCNAVRKSLEAGADVDAFLEDYTPLMAAAAGKDDTKIAQLLLTAGASIHKKNTRNDNAYAIAYRGKNDCITQYLHDIAKGRIDRENPDDIDLNMNKRAASLAAFKSASEPTANHTFYATQGIENRGHIAEVNASGVQTPEHPDSHLGVHTITVGAELAPSRAK